MALLSPVVKELFQKDIASATSLELYEALLLLVKRQAADLPAITGQKKLYYLSAEFLIGRLLGNNLLNLGLYDAVSQELSAAGKAIDDIETLEPEPSLGNGGLGRLAACFMDSVASLGLSGDGIGLNYHLGLFRQQFIDHKQVESPDPWIKPDGWLIKEPIQFTVAFGHFSIQAILNTIAVIGPKGINRLRLFDAETIDESIVGEGIAFDQSDIMRNLTLFLYPDDSTEAGRLLRVYQEYFLASCAAQLILREMEEAGRSLQDLDQYAAIQINDTHPSMIIPELLRLLIEKGIAFDDAANTVARTCAYTNHTILAEALESWPLAFIEEVAPQIIPILQKLNLTAHGDADAQGTEIIDASGVVHMAHLCIHYGHSVNGVAALHTDILKNAELKHFYNLYPQKFQNVTNGVSFRRWLSHANPALDAFLVSLIGNSFQQNPDELTQLLDYREDDTTLQTLAAIKQNNKKRLSNQLYQTQNVQLDAEAVFDIQIKRLHEYKRQQMNALYIIYKYLEIKAGRRPPRPIAVLFGGKAAPAYILAKDIIHLLLCLSKLIADDPAVRPWLQVLMVENYNVTQAEMLIPAADISEQISLASKEASGTGNMKLMVNGAVTIGTLDGANVEIHDLVGNANMYLFGATSQMVMDLSHPRNYHPSDYYRGDSLIERLVDFIISPELRAIGDTDSLLRLYKDLISKDWFMTLLDTRAYIETKEKALGDYEYVRSWRQKSMVNIAMAGYFSSDRSIRQYNERIWHLE